MRWRKIATILFIFIIIGILFLMLVLSKKIHINTWFAKQYEVQGVDVSHYQGEIDWQKIKEQGISFAFIKATEGSSHVDEKFLDNWKQAEEAGMIKGAYHFFSFDSSGKTQAKLYRKTVGTLTGNLIPVIDVEYYGKKEKNPPSKEEVRSNLQTMLDLLEKEYQVKPMIYTTYKVYHTYIKDTFKEYPLWIRNVYYPPVDVIEGWDIWQYSDTGILDGYTGKEVYIDQNVFYGTKEQLKEYLVP